MINSQGGPFIHEPGNSQQLVDNERKVVILDTVPIRVTHRTGLVDLPKWVPPLV